MTSWKLISEHRPTIKGLLQTTWPILLLAVTGVAFGVMMQFVRTKPGEETFTRLAGVVTLVGSVACLGVIPWRYVGVPRSVRVCEEGLQWTQDGRNHERTWDEVREVYRKELHVLQNGAKPSDWNRRSDLRLVFGDGKQTHFNHILSDYNRLAATVQEATASRLLPRAHAALNGAGVDFGPVQVSRAGLTTAAGNFPWQNLNKIWAARGFLGWYDVRGMKGEVALKDIPNYTVLLRLVQEMTAPAVAS
jgi:hypothetical protein